MLSSMFTRRKNCVKKTTFYVKILKMRAKCHLYDVIIPVGFSYTMYMYNSLVKMQSTPSPRKYRAKRLEKILTYLYWKEKSTILRSKTYLLSMFSQQKSHFMSKIPKMAAKSHVYNFIIQILRHFD